MKGPRSLAGRVTLAAVAAVGGALLVASIAVVVISARADRGALDRELRDLAGRAAGPAGRIGPPAGVLPTDRRGRDGDADGRGPLGPGGERFTRLVFPSGVVAAGGAAIPDDFPLPEATDDPVTVTVEGRSWRTIVRPLPDGARLQVAARLEPLEDRERRLRLVVLAACRTGRVGGPAGLAWGGLVQALLTRGAHRVIWTLDDVDDRATAAVMAAFHRARRTCDDSPAFGRSLLETSTALGHPGAVLAFRCSGVCA